MTMNVATSRPIIVDEDAAMQAGLIDPAVPVVPAIEITFAEPVGASSGLFRAPPCAKPVEFLGHLVQEGSLAGNAFGERWNTRAPFTGPAGDDLMDLHADILAAGKLLFTTLSHALGEGNLPQYRFLLNRVENAWLTFNAHAGRTSPALEIRQTRALQDEIAAIGTGLTMIPPTSPDWSSPEFASICKTMLLGAHLTRKESPLGFEFASIPVPVTFVKGTSPVVLCETLCKIGNQMCGTMIHFLESLGVSETIPDDHRKLRDAIRAKFPRLPTQIPLFYIAYHYQVKSTNKRMVPLEEGDESSAILDRMLQPGKDLFVAIKSWEAGIPDIAQIAAYPDTPLPEARQDLMHRLQVACERFREETSSIPQDGRTFLVPNNMPNGILALLRETILSQAEEANAHRMFDVKKIARGKIEQYKQGGQPTNPTNLNSLYFKNKGQIPLRVRYIPAQKTYTITISFAKAGLLCFDGVAWKEAGREKWPKALSTLLKPTVSIEDTHIPATMRDVEMEGKREDGTLTFDVVLRKPVAAPAKFIETHVLEFAPNNGSRKNGTQKGSKKGKK